jgi:hypothetical protein
VPLEHGGSDTDANLRASHRVCNARRGSLMHLGVPVTRASAPVQAAIATGSPVSASGIVTR